MQSLALDEATDAVLSASRALVAVAARSLAAADEDVTVPQHRALVLLCTSGPQTVSRMAAALDCSPSTITRLCDRLVRKELVDRVHRAENRREVEVTITPKGRRLVDHITTRRKDEIARIMDRLPKARRATVVNALRAFAHAAGEGRDQVSASGWDL